MKKLRARRMDLIAAVGQASAAAEAVAAKKRRESDAAAERTDRDRRERIEKEHLRQDRISGRR